MMRRWMFVMTIMMLVTGMLPLSGGETFVAQGPADKKAVALTFDDGPGPWTERILAVLKDKRVIATFFMEGQQAQYRQKLAAAVRDAGQEIGTHTYSHVNFYSYRKDDRQAVLEREISQAQEYIVRATGVRPRLLRMPYGYSKSWARETAVRFGYTMVNWTFGCDWNKMSADQLLAAYIKNIRPGAIFLMHDGGSNRQRTWEMLPGLIDELQRRGYAIVPVSALLGISGQNTAGEEKRR